MLPVSPRNLRNSKLITRYDWFRQNVLKELREEMHNGLVLVPSDTKQVLRLRDRSIEKV